MNLRPTTSKPLPMRPPPHPIIPIDHYTLRLPAQTIFRVSCCLLRYLQTDRNPWPPTTTNFFSSSPHKNLIYSYGADSATWTTSASDFGLFILQNVARIEISITAQKLTILDPSFGDQPNYILEATATCLDRNNEICHDQIYHTPGMQPGPSKELRASVAYNVVVLGENENTWDELDFQQVLACLRRAAKCKFNKYGESRPEAEVVRLARKYKNPIVGANVTTSPPK